MNESKALQFGPGHKSLIRFSWLAVLWSLLLCLGLFSTPATAAVFTVTTTADSGAGSLRQAITDANATVANDIIEFNFAAGTAPYTITLASALPSIATTSTAGTLTITGLGASSLTIDANLGNFGIFNIDSGGNLSISGVTVTGARRTTDNGGAFINSGTLTITNSTLSTNSARNGAGIYNSGTATVTNSILYNNTTTENGGGIFNGASRTLTVSNSTLSTNSAYHGAGIYNSGTATVTHSTLNNNTATNDGGGINSNNGTFILTNSTLSGNTASTGGGIVNFATVTVTNSTISGNSGGGIFNFSTLNIANTIIANSTSGGDYSDGGGTVNLISPATAANNLVSQGAFSWATTKTSAEINLGTLANNGGATSTLALPTGSAAIGTGNATRSNAAPVNGLDQRGSIRSSTAPNIGAFEGQNPANTPTFGAPTSTADGFTVQISNYDGAFTYGGTATASGTVAISGTGLVTVSGVAANTSSTATVTTTRTNYDGGSAQVTAVSLAAASTPIFGTPTSTATGFTVQISNYDATFTYGGTATAGGTVSISGTGLVTVSGVAANTSSTATITTTRTGYVDGSAQVTATSLSAANTPTFGTPTRTAGGFTVQISNYDANFAYGGTATAGGTVSISGAGLVTVSGVAPNTSSTATVTTTRTNYAGGSAQVTAVSLAAPGAPTVVSAIAGNSQATVTFTAPVSNGGAAITSYTVTSSPGGLTGTGSASPITVTGLTNGTSYTFTVTATNSVGTGSASAASNSVTPAAPLATSYTGTTAGGSVTAAITGGSCAGFQDGSAQYNMPATAPAGRRFPYGAFSFTVLSCGPAGSVTITQTYPNSIAPNAMYHKLINGNWVDWTANVTIVGNTVMLTLTDGQSGDTNPTAGEISDPGGITVADDSGMAPIPTLSAWMLMVMAGLMAFVAIRRASAVAKAHMSSQV
jgi:hypothetical protein